MNEWILRELELMLLTAVLIIGAVCIAKCFGHKIGYRWRKLLWLLIAIRLVIPVYSIEEYVEQQMVVERGLEGQDIRIPIAQPSWSRASQVIVLDDVVVDIEADRETAIETDRENTNLPKLEFRNILESFLARYAQKIAGAIWGIGVMLLLGMEVAQYALCKKKYWKSAVVCEDRKIIALWQQICGEGSRRESRNRKKVPEIMICEHVSSPMLMGYWNTVLLLPNTSYSEQEMKMMFCHEAMHYQKKDLWYKLFLSFVCDLYWFNPIYRYMKKLAFQDVEYVCDELVTRDMNKEERYSYGQIILKTMTQTWQDTTAYMTQFAAGKKTAKNRLGLLFTGKHRKIGFAIVVVLLLGIVGISMHVSFVWQDGQMDEIVAEDVKTEDVKIKENQIEEVLQDEGMEEGISNAENIENSDINAYDFPTTYQAEIGNVQFDTEVIVSEAVKQKGLYQTQVRLMEKDYETPCDVIFQDIEIADKGDNIPDDDKRYGRSVWCSGVDDTTFSMNNRHLMMCKEEYYYYRRAINLAEGETDYNADQFLTGEEFDFMTIDEAYQYVLQYMADIGMDIDASDSFSYTCYSMNYKMVEAIENVEKEGAQGNIAYLRQFKQSKWTEADNAYFFAIHQTWQDCMVQYPFGGGSRVADYNAPIVVIVTQNGVVGLDSNELFDFEQGEELLQLLTFEDIATCIASKYNKFLPNSQYIVKSAMLYWRPEEQEDYSFEMIPTWEVVVEETGSGRNHCIYINALNGDEIKERHIL